ncbi:MAG: phosphoribosylaminoimidazolesuccinocarboxamide synthase [Dermatophilaceae bacterium]
MSETSGPALPGYVHVYSGKVRDLYIPLDPATGARREDLLLFVASDRISAYDVILDTPIPDKGVLLTQLSLWWYDQLDGVINHVVSADVPDAVAGRAVLVRRLEMVPIECIGRAYLTGGGLKEYQSTGAVSGVSLPEGLVDGSKLPVPIFTPTTKAPLGQHDQPLTADEVRDRIGPQLAARVDVLTRRILARGNEVAADCGILIADTKLEFGVDRENLDHTGGPTLVLADEALTPDSSRFWPADQWHPGGPQPSYDKQFVRDWLASPESGWDPNSGEPPPPLPDAIVEQTRERYMRAFEQLTGRTFG